MSDTDFNSDKPRRMMYKRINPIGAARVKADFERARQPDESLEQTIRRLLPPESEDQVAVWLEVCQNAPDLGPELAAQLELLGNPEQAEQMAEQTFLKGVRDARKPGETLEQVMRRISPADMSDAEVLGLLDFFQQCQARGADLS